MSRSKFDRLGIDGRARKLLQERFDREEMGDEAYERMTAQYDDRAFKKFGVVFIIAFGVVVSGIAWLGY